MKMASPFEGRGNFFYEVISKVDNKDWLRFVRTKLILEENLIDDIIHDNKDHVEEQKYQMLLKWNMRQGPAETIGKLKNLVNDFYNAMIFLTDPDTSSMAHKEIPDEPNAIAQESSSEGSGTSTRREGAVEELSVHTQSCSTVADNLDLEKICNFEGSLKDFKVLPAPNESFETHKTNIDRVYPVKHDTKGHVLILSNIDFSSSWGSEYNRVGGEFDCSLMESLFEQLGFIVHVERDKTAERIEEIVVEFAGQDFHKEADMCIIIVMSHGGLVNEKDVIYGVDGNYLPAEHVVRYFDNDQCGNLRGKPKLFFFQFCRGEGVDEGVRYDPPDRAITLQESLKHFLPKEDHVDATKSIHTPTRQDVLIAFATQQGNLSFRSWFTNAIANVFSKKAKSDHVCDMLKEVKRGLSKRVATSNNPIYDQGKEMADIRDILLKNLYFFPGHP
ncbi:caspase-2-like [Clavelina lepadiformis]|uniref:caspase-2-like n=1 Tax=Clavelina lepadiformis TaxID=159417 RepID=UPI004041714D